MPCPGRFSQPRPQAAAERIIQLQYAIATQSLERISSMEF
jgi:hypothetical protein